MIDNVTSIDNSQFGKYNHATNSDIEVYPNKSGRYLYILISTKLEGELTGNFFGRHLQIFGFNGYSPLVELPLLSQDVQRSLNWDATVDTSGAFTRVVVEDYSISESNVLTINSGYAVTTGDPFENVWVFAVVPPVVEVETPYVVDFSTLNDSSATSGTVTVTANQVDVPNTQNAQYVMTIDTSDLSTIYEIELTHVGTRTTSNNIWLLGTESMFIRQQIVTIPDFWQIMYARFNITHPDYEKQNDIDITNINGTPVIIKKIRIQAVDPSTIPTTWDVDIDPALISLGANVPTYTYASGANDIRVDFYDSLDSDVAIGYSFASWSQRGVLNPIPVLYPFKFICGNTKALKALDIFLFDEFPQVEKINAEWVSESKQGKTILTRKNFKIKLD